MFRFRTLALAALLVAAAPASPSLAQGGCVSDSEGHQLVAQGQAVPLAVAVSRAGIPNNKVVGAHLCHSGSGYSYRVQLSDGSTRDIPAS